MIHINLLTAGDEKKDESLEKIIERRLTTLADLINGDEVTALLKSLDIALEYFKGKLKLEDQIRTIELENYRIRILRLCQKQC